MIGHLEGDINQHIEDARVDEGSSAIGGLEKYGVDILNDAEIMRIAVATQSELLGEELDVVVVTGLHQKRRKYFDELSPMSVMSSQKCL